MSTSRTVTSPGILSFKSTRIWDILFVRILQVLFTFEITFLSGQYCVDLDYYLGSIINGFVLSLNCHNGDTLFNRQSRT